MCRLVSRGVLTSTYGIAFARFFHVRLYTIIPSKHHRRRPDETGVPRIIPAECKLKHAKLLFSVAGYYIIITHYTILVARICEVNSIERVKFQRTIGKSLRTIYKRLTLTVDTCIDSKAVKCRLSY